MSTNLNGRPSVKSKVKFNKWNIYALKELGAYQAVIRTSIHINMYY